MLSYRNIIVQEIQCLRPVGANTRLGHWDEAVKDINNQLEQFACEKRELEVKVIALRGYVNELPSSLDKQKQDWVDEAVLSQAEINHFKDNLVKAHAERKSNYNRARAG